MRKCFRLIIVAIMLFFIVFITTSCGDGDGKLPAPAKGSKWNSMVWDTGKWE